MKSLTRKKLLLFFTTVTFFFGIVTYLYFHWFLFILLIFFTSCLLVIFYDIFQKKHALLRNFPLVGRLRWVFEHERSKIQQYFIENDTNGTPYSREKRSDIYQKAKKENNTTPFGTQLNVYEKGYEFIKHSMFPISLELVEEPLVKIGSDSCLKPYTASIFNISAMSYGALSGVAIQALNGGAKLGNFYHNTGEGGISPHHLQNNGDLCFQIGTGYFGCGSTFDGKRYFNAAEFLKTINGSPSIKMIEIKLSQGAKPGHGGVLPASKNTLEIAEVRGIEPNIDVLSPPFHTSFNDNKSMLFFIERIRKISGGLPIGIKFCLGDTKDFENLVSEMKSSNIFPDFITIDGGEGGTGAAPIIFTNHVGMPLFDAIKFVHAHSVYSGVRDKFKIIASGKASSSFDIIKLVSLGADIVNAARAFMFSMGCIQARECNMNTCPVGIATQNKELIKGLNPEDKKVRVYNYHKAVIHEIKELLAAMGKKSITEVSSNDIYLRNS